MPAMSGPLIIAVSLAVVLATQLRGYTAACPFCPDGVVSDSEIPLLFALNLGLPEGYSRQDRVQIEGSSPDECPEDDLKDSYRDAVKVACCPGFEHPCPFCPGGGEISFPDLNLAELAFGAPYFAEGAVITCREMAGTNCWDEDLRRIEFTYYRNVGGCPGYRDPECSFCLGGGEMEIPDLIHIDHEIPIEISCRDIASTVEEGGLGPNEFPWFTSYWYNADWNQLWGACGCPGYSAYCPLCPGDLVEPFKSITEGVNCQDYATYIQTLTADECSEWQARDEYIFIREACLCAT